MKKIILPLIALLIIILTVCGIKIYADDYYITDRNLKYKAIVEYIKKEKTTNDKDNVTLKVLMAGETYDYDINSIFCIVSEGRNVDVVRYDFDENTQIYNYKEVSGTTPFAFTQEVNELTKGHPFINNMIMHFINYDYHFVLE